VPERIGRFQLLLERARARRGVALMGVCNVTPDSFSDGGRFLDGPAARARVDQLLSEGADVLDIGGESTRPGAPPVAPGEQLRRVLDVVRYAAERGAVVSVDTTHPDVAGACLEAGACVVNDVSCLRDQALAGVVASAGAALLLMHARGSQQDMRGFSQYPDEAYGDVVADVLAEWNAAASRAVSAGLGRSSLVMDPGLGFAKNARQSAALLARIGEVVRGVDVPVAVGASRKSFLAVVDADAPPGERTGASIAAALHAARAGAHLLRVHDVRATRQALDLERELGGRG
jgi:dihydropteroate synthase